MEMHTNNQDIMIQISGVKKKYRLGQIGGGTLQADLQSWWARKHGKEDPNSKIGQNQRLIGQTFMALNGVDLTVHTGEALGIIGGNGAGKSTLLKLISQVTAPSAGSIDLYGRVASMLEVGTGFNGEMTGRENVYMNGTILGMTKKEIDAKIDQIIEFSEVKDFIDTPVKRYSSGMYVKLAFSVAAHLDSEIMIMDEVLAVGDVAFQKKCLNKMREVATKEGRTVLYVSHNMNTIRELCDRCVVLDKGKVIYDGEVESAIRYYMGTGADTILKSEYHLGDMKRRGETGKSARISQFKFLKDIPAYEVGEDVSFSITIDSNIEIENAQVLIPIKDENYVKVGMIYSEVVNIKKAKNQIFQFAFSTNMLTASKYCLDIAIVKVVEGGEFFSFDNPGEKIIIELRNNENHGIAWHNEFWGRVALGQARKI